MFIIKTKKNFIYISDKRYYIHLTNQTVTVLESYAILFQIRIIIISLRYNFNEKHFKKYKP